MRISPFVEVLIAVSWIGASACAEGRAEPKAPETQGLWIGSAHVSMSKGVPDMSVGYTMRSDFWFRVDASGRAWGKAYAIYQPTFEADGMNAKIELVKSMIGGVLSISPGGKLAVYKSAIEAGKAETQIAIAGLVGVVGEYKDPKPIRTGEITGSVQGGTLTLGWANPPPAEIPLTVSLQYLTKKVPTSQTSVSLRHPWEQPAVIDRDSGGRFAISQDQKSHAKDDVTGSTFAYWTAIRVD